MKYILFLALPLYLLDQLTKWLVIWNVTPDEPQVVIPDVFWIAFITNTGAAFGSFKGNNLFFIGLSAVALTVVLTLLLRRHVADPLRDTALALLLAGVLGNLTDRLIHGHVIDFLLFDLHVPLARPWPAFNVADACICIAVGCFIIHTFREGRVAKSAAAS